MRFEYSTITRILTVFGAKMTHVFNDVNFSEVDSLIVDAKFKEAIWRA
ncbi:MULTISPECIES: hypothetical protein [unclassified Acinetobacter]|nr:MULTISPECIES: hypothetical protein [unclassified Acinetobacter]WOE32142.1 hypothetical protein QSG84_02710 [Acinetobacter sp. SAAs470]WOE37612.1 hypothetical protein QSG86_11755 [Acinetobacter sp. SAAs474]